MPPAARKPATRKTAPKPAVRRATTTRAKKPTGPAPAVVLTSNPEADAAAAEQRFPLFQIDGVVYSMPARPPAGLALQLLDDFEIVGEAFAGLRLLKTLIGDEAYARLKTFKGLQPADLTRIAEAAMKITLGALEEEDPAGN